MDAGALAELLMALTRASGDPVCMFGHLCSACAPMFRGRLGQK
jgi:hypothetical protein